MKEYDGQQDPARDPELREALAALEPIPQLDEEGWDSLRRRIRHGAAMPLARRRASARRPALRWGLSAAAAAGLAALIWARIPDQEPDLAVRVGPSVTAEEALQSDLSEAEFRSVVSGRAEADELLLIAVGDG